jgi:hypothetical protein
MNRCLATRKSYQTATPIERSWTDQLKDIRTRPVMESTVHVVLSSTTAMSPFQWPQRNQNSIQEWEMAANLSGSPACSIAIPSDWEMFTRVDARCKEEELLTPRMWTCGIVRVFFRR